MKAVLNETVTAHALRRPDARSTARRLPLHAAVAQAGRQGNPAQRPEPDLFSDQRRRPRSRARRGGPDAASRATTGSSPTTAIARCACSSASRRSRCCSPRSAPRTIPRPAAGRCRRTGATRNTTSSRARARPARRCCRPSAPRKPASSTAACRRFPIASARYQDRRDHLRLARRRRDQRRRVLGSAERRLHQAAAGAVPRRGQRLRHLGSGRSADRRRRHLAAGASFPGLHVDSIDGTDFFASLRAMREAAAYVRARKGPAFVHARVHPSVFALAVRRREALQADRRSSSAARSGSIIRTCHSSRRQTSDQWGVEYTVQLVTTF